MCVVGYKNMRSCMYMILCVVLLFYSAMPFPYTRKSRALAKYETIQEKVCGIRPCWVPLTDVVKYPNVHLNENISQVRDTPNIVNSTLRKRKRHFCVFCKLLYVNIPRHLENVHSNIPEVKKFISLPKLSPERKMIIDKIRKEGDFQYNTKAIYNGGELIVCRRPSEGKQKKPEDYVTCPKCKGFMSIKTMYQHHRRCDSSSQKGIRNVLSRGKQLIARFHPLASQSLKDRVFPSMRDDEIVRLLKYDSLLIMFGNKLCQKYKHEHLNKYIRQILRTLGRVLLAIKEIDVTITDFASILSPRKYDTLLEAVYKVANYDSNTSAYTRPTLAFNIGTYVKKCAKLLITHCIKEENFEKKSEVENFLKVFEEDYATAVNKTAIENQSDRKRKKSIDLPSSSDIELLRNYLETQRYENYTKLRTVYEYENWLALAKCALTYIQIFNRRRAGEVERILISDYKSYHTIDQKTDIDIYESLSAKAKHSANNFVRFQIRGKLGRSVSILLHKKWFKALEMIINYRTHAGVLPKNPYVFGIPGGKGNYNHLRACELMRNFANECGAAHPNTLRGTLLRKHIATVVQKLNLSDSDMMLLANFMGHDEKIHKSHYRLPIAAKEIGQMTNLLTVIERGEVNKHKGQNLDQLCHGDADIDESSNESDGTEELQHAGELQETERDVINQHKGQNLDQLCHRDADINESSNESDGTEELQHAGELQETERDVIIKHKVQNLDQLCHRDADTDESSNESDGTEELQHAGEVQETERDVIIKDKVQKLDQLCHRDADINESSDKSDGTEELQHAGEPQKFERGKLKRNKLKRSKLKNIQHINETTPQKQFPESRARHRHGRVSPMGKIIRIPWTTPERHVTRKYFKTYLETNDTPLPNLEECYTFIKRYSSMKRRSAMQVRLWIHNQKRKKKLEYENYLPEKKTWTTPEKHVLQKVFKRHIVKGKTPSTAECEDIQERALKDRTVPQIKCWVNNFIRKNRKANSVRL